jgi:hypothetical protein
MRVKLLVFTVVLSVVSSGFADSGRNSKSSEALALEALSDNVKEADAAIAALRAEGTPGLDAFLNAHAAELKSREAALAGNAPRSADQAWQRLSAALDRLCQQRDCYASRLYWYTNLDEAKAAARFSGKPILSLRLLGKLDEELSCANSRFFRIVLYANDEVSAVLRERFILHWQSVRQVPKVTIDFGDGRKLERTLTGNSIHYVLDGEGRPIDALPGLYGPRAFLRELSRVERAVTECKAARTDQERQALLRQYHVARLMQLSAEWQADVATANISSPPSRDVFNPNGGDARPPRAQVAVGGAITKAAMERPVLRGISSSPRILDPTAEDAAWGNIAALHAQDARLDESSRMLIRAKNLGLYGGSEPAARASVERAWNELERAIAKDTVRNEYVLHTKIHEWFVRAAATFDLATLNDRVYAELFLTPASDPWLGLFPGDSYTGIENDGIRK